VAKLLRFIGIIVAAALVTAGGITATVAVASGFASHTESATAFALPALGSVVDQPSVVYASDGTTVLGTFQGPKTSVPVTLSRVPTIVIAAVLDTEDQRFFVHGGYDIPSIVRALGSDSSGNSLQGGSTITQQLVKNIYLSSQRTLTRKFKEAVIASRLQKQYTKNAILQAYLNTIYLGEGAYGIQAAAQIYYNQPIGQSTLAEAALFAGMIHDPNGDDPIVHPSAARARRAFVLSRMVHYGSITQAQADAANKSPLPTTITVPQSASDSVVDNYVQQVETFLLDSSSSPLGGTYNERYQSLFEGGLKIYTDLNLADQADAEAALAKDIYPVGAEHAVNGSPDTGALVAIQPSTGDVVALVGGPGGKSKFDLATEAYRQPGSGFKLFTLLAAYENGFGPADQVDGTAPCAVQFPGPYGLGYMPPNPPANNAGDGEGKGLQTIDEATVGSINCAFIRLAQKVGLDKVLPLAESLGVTTESASGNPSNFIPYPSVVIGGQGVTVLDMANAYATVADNGVYHTPQYVNHIVDNSGTTFYTEHPVGEAIIPQQVDLEATQDLEHVVQYGTGTDAELYGREAAGKTGTTDKSVDAWFNGFTPQLAASVWMGNPAGDSQTYGMLWGYAGQVFGGDYPATTWHDFMTSALAGQPDLSFAQPNPSLIPPGKVIQSPGTGGVSIYGYNPITGLPNIPTTTTTTAPSTTTVAPTTVSPTQPTTATTSAPGTTTPRSPPTT